MHSAPDHDYHRKGQLIAVLDHIIKATPVAVEGLVVIGSLGYNWDHHVLIGSDLDCAIIGNRSALAEVLSTPFFATKVPYLDNILHLLIEGQIDVVSLKSDHEGIPFSVHLTPPNILAEGCKIEERALRAFRLRAKTGKTKFYSFTGEHVVYEFQNTPIGCGYIHTLITCLVREERYFTGVMHGWLLHMPRIIIDRNGSIAYSLQQLWEAFLARMFQEQGETIDLSRVNPLLALKNAKYFSEETKIQVIEKTRVFCQEHNLRVTTAS